MPEQLKTFLGLDYVVIDYAVLNKELDECIMKFIKDYSNP